MDLRLCLYIHIQISQAPLHILKKNHSISLFIWKEKNSINRSNVCITVGV